MLQSVVSTVMLFLGTRVIALLADQRTRHAQYALDMQFIYISKEEMATVADFIKRRGRVAISELAAKSNTFIDLEARASAVCL